MKIVRLLTCATLLLPALAYAAPAHVHGGAKLDLAVEGDKLIVGMEMPLDNTLGFERLPRSEKEKLAFVAMMTTLKNAADLFMPTAAAGCRLESAEVGDPFPGGKAKPDGHADIDADYVFRCAKVGALKSLETTLFKHFARLKRIDVQRATPGGQGKASMTAESPSVSW